MMLLKFKVRACNNFSVLYLRYFSLERNLTDLLYLRYVRIPGFSFLLTTRISMAPIIYIEDATVVPK